jgi:hypothetical protein
MRDHMHLMHLMHLSCMVLLVSNLLSCLLLLATVHYQVQMPATVHRNLTTPLEQGHSPPFSADSQPPRRSRRKSATQLLHRYLKKESYVDTTILNFYKWEIIAGKKYKCQNKKSNA